MKTNNFSKKCCFLLITMCVLVLEIESYKFIQKRAEVHDVNHKWVKDVHIVTVRARRGDSYKTNITTDFFWPFDNNASFSLTYGLQGGQKVTLVDKVCSIFKKNLWVTQFVNNYMDRKITKCPIEAGLYKIRGMELPPKNFPLPVFRGIFNVDLIFMQTETKEVMVGYILVVQVI